MVAGNLVAGELILIHPTTSDKHDTMEAIALVRVLKNFSVENAMTDMRREYEGNQVAFGELVIIQWLIKNGYVRLISPVAVFDAYYTLSGPSMKYIRNLIGPKVETNND